jgi:ferrochelatase
VRRYLREFLSDPRVLDLPPLPRWLLLNLVILPRRPRASAAAYRAVWTPAGSPLLVHSRALTEGVARELGPAFRVELGMRYGEPSLAGALARLRSAGAERILALPLYPQYAASSSGSALACVFEIAAAEWDVAAVAALEPFHADPGFLDASAAVARETLAAFRADHVLLSFHGLPERQVRRSDPSGGHCLARPDCCDVPAPAHRRCYRAQCAATARALAARLGLAPEAWSFAFQSRLGRTPWIRPYTDERLPELAARGVKRLAVLCPSFVADCLETLEEIGLRGREQWRSLGGDDLVLVPSLNAHPAWVAAVAALVRQGVR